MRHKHELVNEQPDNSQCSEAEIELQSQPFQNLDSTIEMTEDSFQPETVSLANSFLSDKFRGGSTLASILTLLAATVGTGILMIPNSMAASGIIWGVIQMIICAYLSYFSLVTVVKCANHMDMFSYQDLALATYGNACRQIVNVASFFANWGSAILYLKLITELFAISASIVIGSNNSYLSWIGNPESKPLSIIVATIFILPLSLSKNYQGLRHFTILNVLFVIFFCFVVVYQGFNYQPIQKSFQTARLFVTSGFFTTFPSAIFGYMSHANVLGVFKELHTPSVSKMKKILKYTIGFVLITYVVVGVIGYSTFSGNLSVLSHPDTSNGIILIAYGYTPSGDKEPYPSLVIICMVLMSISVMISQPFNIKPAKESLVNFLTSKSDGPDVESTESSSQNFRYIAITLYSGVIVGLFFESIQKLMDILGSSFFSLICFTLPSMFYLKVFRGRMTLKERMTHRLIVISSILFAIYGTIDNFVTDDDDFDFD